jgi:hypothetical protein
VCLILVVGEVILWLVILILFVCLFFDKIPEGRPLRSIIRHPGFEPWVGALLTSGLCHCLVNPFVVAYLLFWLFVLPVFDCLCKSVKVAD